MRTVEILISVLLGIYLAWRHPRPIFIRLAPAAAVLLTLIHFAIEGYRWQMIPVYVLTSLLAISALTKLNSAQDWRSIASYLTLALLAVSMALPILLPVPPIPKPTGEFAVGTTSFSLTDGSRRELYSGKDEARKFVVQMWYPARRQAGDKRAPWMAHAEIFGPAIATYLHLPRFFLDHLSLVRTPAFIDAPMAQQENGFPVVIFSHGWNGFNAQSTAQALQLASHGYVVVAINHTYGAIVTLFPDGEIAYNNPNALPEGAPDDEYEIAARKLVDQWAGDIAYTLDELTVRSADGANPLFSGMDLSRLGVYGHSTGGGAAIEFCGRDTRCKAVLGLDPFMRPVSTQVLSSSLQPPALFIFSEAWAKDTNSRNNQLFFPFYSNAQQPCGVISINGTHHQDFTDLPMLTPIASQLGLKGPISAKEMNRIMDKYLLSFFGATLQGADTDSFSSAAPEFPEVNLIR